MVQISEIKSLSGHDPGLCFDPLKTRRGALLDNRTHALFLRYVDTYCAIRQEMAPVWCAMKCRAKRGKNRNANDPTTDPQTAAAENQTIQVDALAGMPPKTWCLH
jgi:hypothetical protein